MFAVRSRALACCSSRALLAKRAFASHADKGGTHHNDDHHHHGPPVEEAFGKGFYLSIAAVVGGLAFYRLEQSVNGARSPLTRAIEYYSNTSKDWEDRNSRHTAMVERAAKDRSLFEDSKPSNVVNLKFPEILNGGSPYMNEIGWRGNDLLALQAHCEAQRK